MQYSFRLGDNSGAPSFTDIVEALGVGTESMFDAEKEVLQTGESGALKTQVGGSHYKKYPIQPVEYSMANNLNYCQANAIKYITRYRDKGGVEDLRKAIHNIEILIEMEDEKAEKEKPVRQRTRVYGITPEGRVIKEK